MSFKSMIALSFMLTLGACSQKKLRDEVYHPRPLGADAAPSFSYNPTRPDGGIIPGKFSPMSEEEKAKRKAKNEVEPIVFGLSAGGISMQTSFQDAMEILSPALGSNGSFLFYPERIAVAWGGSEAAPPSRIIVLEDYPGPLSLVAPVGTIRVGDQLSKFFGLFPSETTIRAYLKALGAAIEKRPPSYDCEQDQTCRLSYIRPGSLRVMDLEFKNGFIRLSGDGTAKVNFLSFNPPTLLPARLRGPVDYFQQKINEFTPASTREQIEQKLGRPIFEDAFAAYYDRGAFVISKSPQGIALFDGFQDPIDFGPNVGPRYLGESFADAAPQGDDGTQLMLILDRILEKRATADFDCRTLSTPCQISSDGERLYIQLDKGLLSFTADESRTWISLEFPSKGN